MVTEPYVTTICPLSKRVDDPTLHSTRFDGDDPYTVCVYCGETRDAVTGRIIHPATKGSGGEGGDFVADCQSSPPVTKGSQPSDGAA